MNSRPALHQLSVAELQTQIATAQKAKVQAVISLRAGKPVKGSIRTMSDHIARLLTVLREKELAV